MSHFFKKLGMFAGAAAPFVVKYVPGIWGLGAGAVLTGVAIICGYNTPTPAAVKAFGDGAK